jgi:hypothetical protein
LDIRVISTQGTSSKRGFFFLNPKIFLSILDELEESRFWRKRERG